MEQLCHCLENRRKCKPPPENLTQTLFDQYFLGVGWNAGGGWSRKTFSGISLADLCTTEILFDMAVVVLKQDFLQLVWSSGRTAGSKRNLFVNLYKNHFSYCSQCSVV